MNLGGKIVRSSVTVFYLLIGLEIIIMISPFAAYFYAGYGPLLNALQQPRGNVGGGSASQLLQALNGHGTAVHRVRHLPAEWPDRSRAGRGISPLL